MIGRSLTDKVRSHIGLEPSNLFIRPKHPSNQNQGFTQANQLAQQDMMTRQGLGTYMDQMGQAQQAYDQATKDAATMAAREAEFEPYTRLGLIGQQLAQIQPGAFPTTTVGYQPSQAPASPMASFLGGAAGAGGILGKLGIFGS